MAGGGRSGCAVVLVVALAVPLLLNVAGIISGNTLIRRTSAYAAIPFLAIAAMAFVANLLHRGPGRSRAAINAMQMLDIMPGSRITCRGPRGKELTLEPDGSGYRVSNGSENLIVSREEAVEVLRQAESIRVSTRR